ncbi:hypothetical protein M3P36_03190 [Altererythrobacter sp. KTW20L]|uniref:hypothetical protein n=1 Tax=Altererythrobacter sp. KTW20L TaxID=2942210 RepID=UPI0020BEFDE7|nr:hypothetical protein [Altererythrobacter sp. KTW20L]MCL6250055.1 hypothetical protein [Altererythrobacter sp. KTW20L]
MKHIRLAAALAGLSCVLVAAPAAAQSSSFRVEANDTHTVDITICNPEVYVEVRGDGDTDLDFSVTDPRGNIVHSDYDLTDITFFTLYRQASSGCEDYPMEVMNLGDVWNRFEVTLTTMRSDAASPRASADGNNRNVSFANQGKETIFYIYWRNIAASGWSADQLGSSILSAGDSWQTTVDDGSGACRFDFRAVTAGGREMVVNDFNVCTSYTITFR